MYIPVWMSRGNIKKISFFITFWSAHAITELMSFIDEWSFTCRIKVHWTLWEEARWYYVSTSVRISRSNTSTRLWENSSTSELFRLPEWWEKNLTSKQRSSKDWFPVSSRFSELLFLDVPGTATEQVRNCGFRRNSSNFDRATNIRDFVLLNSFESFLVTLSSISSKTWEND